MMPTSARSPSKNSFNSCFWIYATAAGHRLAILSRSCTKLAGGSTIRPVSRTGWFLACDRENGGWRFSLVVKRPWTWHALIRTSSITGVFEASDSANPCSTIDTIDGRFGRGSSSHICDFIAKA